MNFQEWYLSLKKAVVRVLVDVIELFWGPLTLRSLALDSRLRPAERLDRVEQALQRSGGEQLDWDSGEDTDQAELVLADEVSDCETRAELAKSLAKPLRVLREYKRLCEQVSGRDSSRAEQVEERRAILYDSDSKEHEKKLLLLWKLLKEDEPLEARKSRQWQEIGFQAGARRAGAC